MTPELARLIEHLEATPSALTLSSEGLSPARLTELETTIGRALPADLQALLARFGDPFGTRRFTLELDLNDDQLFREHLGGLLILGSDGGGALYALDTDGSLGCGAQAVIRTDMGRLEVPEALVVANSVTQLIWRLVRKETLEESPRVKNVAHH